MTNRTWLRKFAATKSRLLQKPFSAARLAQKIREVLKEKPALRAVRVRRDYESFWRRRLFHIVPLRSTLKSILSA